MTYVLKEEDYNTLVFNYTEARALEFLVSQALKDICIEESTPEIYAIELLKNEFTITRGAMVMAAVRKLRNLIKFEEEEHEPWWTDEAESA